MRKAFIETLLNSAAHDEGIFLLTGDLGFSVLEPFTDKFPKRFYDAGVAEQNMIGVASGLALSGKTVFVYSIVPFITMRCFEQVRNNICFQNLNVKLIGIGGGVVYGTSGTTHYALEDIAIMRSLVNMTVIVPGDPLEAAAAVRAAAAYPYPVYIRLGKGNEPVLHASLDFHIGKAITMSEGNDITIISCGSILNTAKAVAQNLQKEGLSVSLISMPTIKPLDREAVELATRRTKAVFTIEEHSEIGGLGSAVSEVIIELDKKVLFKKFAVADKYYKEIGSQKYILERNGLTENTLIQNIIALYKDRQA